MEDKASKTGRAGRLTGRLRWPSRTPVRSLNSSGIIVLESDHALLLDRKSITPRKSFPRSSVDDASFIEIDMEKYSIQVDVQDKQANELHQPKAFHQRQRWMGFNCGRWYLYLRHGSIFAVVFVAIFVPIWYATIVANNNALNAEIDGGASPFSFDCGSSPGHIDMSTVSPGLLGIDMKFGRLSFDEAKGIDLAWNVLVGRGVQAILSVVSYRVFSDALLRAAEMTHLSYDLYASLSLSSNKGNMAWQLTKSFGKKGNWRTK